MKTIVFRTLGGRGIGYGHLYRCLSLGKAMRFLDKKIDIIFLINNELVSIVENNGFKFIISDDLYNDFDIIDNLSIDLFIFDSYLGSNEYLRRIKEKSKLVLIDDNNDIYDSSIPDILSNGNIHSHGLEYHDIVGQIKLLGIKYLVMKEEYWDNSNDNFLSKTGILITTGGTDEYGITIKIIEELQNLDIEINVVIGPAYSDDYIKQIEHIRTKNIKLIYKPDSLKDYIKHSKIVITAGGSTVYEVLSQKSIPIIFSIADNQDLICRELINAGVEYVGKYPNIEYDRLTYIIKKMRYSRLNLNNEIINLVEGNGALIVAEILLSQL